MKVLKKVLLSLFILAVLAVAAGALAFRQWNARLDAFAEAPHGEAGERVVTVPPGSGPRKVGSLLAEAGLVTDAELYYSWLRREELGPRLKAGEYDFTGPVTPRQVTDRLISGVERGYRFTIPEGLRAEEILPIVAKSELGLSLQKLEAIAADPAFLHELGVPAQSIEGFLHPDTYTFTRGADERAVLKKMVQRTMEEFQAADAQRRAGVTLDLLQAVTLASIVEKETGAPQERPRISCVFHNRLRDRWPLATDPTVIYAMRLRTGVYNKNIRRVDLQTPHPYNTYLNKGLPPGPIASPGAAALKAALNPPDCTDMFFVSRNDGTHIFCPTLACHEAAVQKWQVEYFRKKR